MDLGQREQRDGGADRLHPLTTVQGLRSTEHHCLVAHCTSTGGTVVYAAGP